jgi:hypothetical protein
VVRHAPADAGRLRRQPRPRDLGLQGVPERFDPTCASQRRENHTDYAPAAIGQYTTRLDVFHADSPNYRNWRNDLIDFIKSGTDVAQAIKDAWAQLNKS